MSSETVVYCLCTPDRKRTYVGVTDDLTRRLQQHRGQLKGGAKTTRGNAWNLLYVVRGLPDRRTALQLEWRLHRRCGPSKHPTGRRAWQLAESLTRERVTNSAVPTEAFAHQLVVEWHHEKDFRDWHNPLIWPLGLLHTIRE